MRWLLPLLLTSCAFSDDTTTEPLPRLDPSLPAAVQLTKVESRESADGTRRGFYAASFEGLPIHGVERRGLEIDGTVQWARPWIFSSAAEHPVRTDLGEAFAVARALDDLVARGDGSLSVVESVRGWIPTVTPDPAGRRIDSLELGYQIIAAEAGPTVVPRRVIYFVAGDGRIVDRTDPRSYLQATGHSFHNGDVPIEVSAVPGPAPGYHLVDEARAKLTTSNWEKGQCPNFCSSTHFVSPVREFGTGRHAAAEDRNTEDGQTSGVDVHYAMGTYWDFVFALFKRRGPLDADVPVNAIVNIEPEEGTQAFFEPLPLGNGFFGVTFFTAARTAGEPFTTVQGVAHEQTHGMIYRELAPSSGIFHSSTATPHLRGIDEGLADVFGMMTDLWRVTRGTTVPNTQGVWTIGDQPGRYPRYFHRPSADEHIYNNAHVQSDDAYPPVASDEHLQGGIVRRAFYFLAQGVAPEIAGPFLAHELGSQYLPAGLTGVTNDTATRLFYDGIVTFSDVQPDYFELRRSVLLAAEVGYGKCSVEHKAVADAFAAVNVGTAADRTPPTAQWTVDQTPAGVVVSMTTEPAATGVVTVAGVPGRFAISGGGVTIPASLFPSTGDYTFTLTLEDTCDNTATLEQHLVVDRTPPTVTISTSPGILPRTMQVVVVARDASQIDGGTIKFGGTRPAFMAVSGSPATYRGTFSFEDEPHGQGTIVVTANDRFGNVTSKVATVLFDLRPPDSCSPSLDRASGLHRWFLMSASDESPLVLARVSGAGIATVVKEFGRGAQSGIAGPDIYFPSAGSYQLDFECVDAYGNVKSTPLAVSVSRGPSLVVGIAELSRSSVTVRAAISDDVGLARWGMRLECNGLWTYRGNATSGTAVVVNETFSLASYPPGTRCTAYIDSVDTDTSGVSDLAEFLVPWPPGPPPLSCGNDVHAGGNQPETFDIDVHRSSGRLNLWWQSYTVPDEIVLSCADGGLIDGASSARISCRATGGWVHWIWDYACNSSRIHVSVRPNCDGSSNTEWTFRLGCVN